MTSELIVFLVLSLVAISSALACYSAVTRVFSVVSCVELCDVAVFYLLLGAPFIAMSQITVYAARSWCCSCS